MMTAWPAALRLPVAGGYVTAVAAAGRPIRYTVEGEIVDIDVNIPDDLLAAGWFWHGGCLCRHAGILIGISSALIPPPGWRSGTDIFEAARVYERTINAAPMRQMRMEL